MASKQDSLEMVDIDGLKREIENLKSKVYDARQLNYRLQVELIRALSGETLDINLSETNRSQLDLIIKEEEGYVIYNEIHIPLAQDERLKKLQGPDKDRHYIKELFEIVFSDSYFQQACRNGSSRLDTLNVIKSSPDFHTMKKMFERRMDDVETSHKRKSLLDEVIRRKVYNWWQNHATKFAPQK